jgi:hypothetical protein
VRSLEGRGRALLLSVVAAVVLATTIMTPRAFAASSPAPATKVSRPIAVSVPPNPVPIGPGATSKVHIRVVNPGNVPVTVTVTGRGLDFGDNGKVNLTTRPDPRWLGRIDFPAGNLVLQAQSFDDLFLTVRMPDHISPDLYFVGFVVSPVPTRTGSVTLINQIGSFFIIDVPGPRVRKLSARLDVPGFNLGPIHLGSVAIGDRARGEVRVRNVGHATARFWGENDTSSSPGGSSPSQQLIQVSLLPVGHLRSYVVSAHPAWPVGLVTMSVHIIYPDKTENATAEITLTKRVLVISPWVIVVLFVLLALATWLLRRRWKRRKALVGAGRPRREQNQAGGRSPRRNQSGPRHARSSGGRRIRSVSGQSRNRTTVH